MRSSDWKLEELPGPKRFLASVARSLDLGRSVLLVVPEYAVDSGLADRLWEGRGWYVHVSIDADALEVGGGSLPQAVSIAADFLTPLTSETTVDRWRCYLEHEDAQGKSVLVAAWDNDFRDDLEYWLRLVHGSPMGPEDRPTFVVMTRTTDLEVDGLARAHGNDLDVVWWWGAIGLLDSELCVDLELSDENLSPLRRAMMSETMGWEIDLIPDCAAEWNSDSPPSVLAKIAAELGTRRPFSLDDEELAALDNEPVQGRPPRELLSAWNRGYVDAWNGHHRVGIGYERFEDVLDRRFWSAQARILMPYFERQRARLEQWCQRRATPHVISEIANGSDLLELNRMRHAGQWGKVVFAQEDLALLGVLVEARNKIAHHQSLEDVIYDELARLVS